MKLLLCLSLLALACAYEIKSISANSPWTSGYNGQFKFYTAQHGDKVISFIIEPEGKSHLIVATNDKSLKLKTKNYVKDEILGFNGLDQIFVGVTNAHTVEVLEAGKVVAAVKVGAKGQAVSHRSQGMAKRTTS